MATSNKLLATAAAGMAGAVCVNLAHETTRLTVADAPRMDVIGMRAVSGIARALGMRPPEHLRTTTFAADIVTNSLYYSMVAAQEQNVRSRLVLLWVQLQESAEF